MFIKIHLSKVVIAGSVAIAAAIVFVAYASSPFDIEFPIAELGNCADKVACKTYCDKPTNVQACDAFAANHGLGGRVEGEGKANVDAFVAAVEEDGGPDGQCGKAADPVKACKSACDESANTVSCIRYALHKNLVEGRERVEMAKVLAALERGVAMPPGGKEACENPKDIAELEQCMEFGIEAGLLPEKVDPAQARKMVQAMKEGKIPFKNPREFEKCDNPLDEATLTTCIEVGIQMGMISEKEAKMAKLTGGKGPGGCRGRECEGFCEHEDNQEACSAFMTKLLDEHPEVDVNDIIPEEGRIRMQEGLGHMKEGLAGASEEVKTCINETFPGFTGKIESGTLGPRDMMTIGPKMGSVMKGCFEQFGGGLGGPGSGGAFPEEARQCLVQVFGVSDMSELKKRPTSEEEAQLRGCIEGVMGVPSGEGFGPQERMPGVRMGPDGMGSGSQPPAEIKGCMDQLGIGMDRQPSAEQRAQIETCVRGKMMQGGGFPGEGGAGEQQGGPRERFRPGEGNMMDPTNIMRPPEGFRPGEDMMEPPEGFRPSDGFIPPEGVRPPEGFMMPEGLAPREGIPFNIAPPPDQYRQEYQQQYQQQYQQPYEQYPAGGAPPPTEPPREPAPPPGPSGFHEPRTLVGFALYLLEGWFGQ